MQQTIKVWDIFVRLFHWSLVLLFALAWLSGEGDLEQLHAWAGYLIGILVAMRLIWGIIGTKHARFSNFIYRPVEVAAYLKSLTTAYPKHFTGHNPAGGAMVVVMLFILTLVTWTGLETYAAEGHGPLASSSMQITTAHADDDWSDHHSHHDAGEFWEDIHEFSVNLMLILIFIHLAGVAISSLLHGENLPRAMITGRKKQPMKDQSL